MNQPEPLDVQLADLLAFVWKLERDWAREDRIDRILRYSR
jgi:hypothetical protein